MTPDFIKALSGVFLQGLQSEFPVTSKVLAAVPDQNQDYRPDAKSKTAMELAWHIASVDIWFIDCIVGHSFKLPQREMPAGAKTGADLAAWYDKEIAAGVPRIQAMTAEQLATPLDFYGMFNMPAAMYLQFMNNHMIHHRGQLSTYLRAMGGKCPSIYGGSADEPMGA
ncbi:MAG: DinB family protein [Acidobacteria bacterium]|nr:DinB family protein [Acidobacteriota bacterium]